MTGISVLIPAAGASRRMRGSDKLLETVDGAPILRGVVKRAFGVSPDVIVTLPNPDTPRVGAIKGLPARIVFVPDADEGMAASFRAAAHTVPSEASGLLVLPADMPDISSADLGSLADVFLTASGKTIVQGAGSDGTPGHPVIFPSDLIPGFADLSGDRGAKPIITANKHRLHYVRLPNQNALTDLDTPEAWQSWRVKNPNR